MASILILMIFFVVCTGLCSSFANEKTMHRIYRMGQFSRKRALSPRWDIIGSSCGSYRSSIILNYRNVPFRFYQSNRPRLNSQTNDGKIEQTKDLRLVVPTVDDMEEIGAFFASMISQPHVRNNQLYTTTGLVLFLDGDLGAGKTVFSRGFVRYATSNNLLQVTSPTYLLSNSYEAVTPAENRKSNPIYHMDLYRLDKDKTKSFMALNIPQVFQEAVSLIEWPSRLPDHMIPIERLDLRLTIRRGSDSINGDDDPDSGIDMDSAEREVIIKPIGLFWEELIQDIVTEGYLDDMLS